MGNTPCYSSNAHLLRFRWATCVLIISTTLVAITIAAAFPVMNNGDSCQKADESQDPKSQFIFSGLTTLFMTLFLIFFIIAFKDEMFYLSDCYKEDKTGISDDELKGTKIIFTIMTIIMIIYLVVLVGLGAWDMYIGLTLCR